jgi:hypothetical protein
MSLKRFDLDVFSAQTELFQRTLHSDLFLFRFVVAGAARLQRGGNPARHFASQA